MLIRRTQPIATEFLTSLKNPLLKGIRQAVHKGSLTAEGYAVAESFHLLDEAIRSDCEIGPVIVAESVRRAVESHVEGLKNGRIIRVTDELFRQLSSTETSQGVITLVRPPIWDLDHLLRGQSLVMILDGIQDPGNAGAIVRAAEGFGATGVLFLKGTTHAYSPKALRASAGSAFRLPILMGLEEEIALAACKQKRLDLYAAAPGGLRLLPEVDLTRRCGLIIGSEGRGVSAKMRDQALDVRIPTANIESLNAAVAAGVLLYEARRQRQPA